MISAIAQFFGTLISFIYEYVPNFGAAILILTVMVKLVTFPLNNKQIQSTKKMQLLQPEMKKIQQKYKDDQEKQNKAMTEFMREHNMNPLAGCLPLLVQFPILIGIFRLLQAPENYLNMEVINPYLFQSAELVNLLNMPLTSLSVENFLGQVSYYYLFPIIAGATTYLYSKMSMPADSSQKMLMYMMPVMITVFSFSFPVGLVLYWTMNNIFSIGQHKLITYLDTAKTQAVDEKTPKEEQGREDRSEKISKPDDDKKAAAGPGTKKPKTKDKKGKGKK